MAIDWDDPTLTFPSLGESWIRACKHSGNPVVISDTLGTRLRAKQALTGSIVLSRRLARLNPEQNIGLLLPTSAGGMVANMACQLLGKTVINLNFTASMDALLSSIEQTGLQRLFTSSRFLQRLRERGLDIARLEAAVTLITLEDLRETIGTGEKLATLTACHCLSTKNLQRRYCRASDPAQTAVILFSSGSEGDPKGIMLSHHNLQANIAQIVDLLCMDDSDLLLANLPLFHAFGLTATLFMPLLYRHPVLCHPDPTDAPGIANAIEQHGATIMFGTSSFLRLYTRNSKVQPEQLNSLRLVVAGAEKLQDEVREDFQDKFGKAIHEGYGTTETAPVASVNLPDDLARRLGRPLPAEKTGSVGQPIPGTTLRVVDPGSFDELPTGEAGLILISGPQVMQGYLNAPDKNDEALHELDGRRWYATGDKGYLDEDGFLFIIDRYSRFAKVSGEMIGLGMVEQMLHEVIDDHALEVLAVSVPDSRKGESIVVLSNQPLDDTTLRPRLLDRGLSTLALPSHYFQVEEIPTLGSGKRDFGGGKALALQLLGKS